MALLLSSLSKTSAMRSSVVRAENRAGKMMRFTVSRRDSRATLHKPCWNHNSVVISVDILDKPETNPFHTTEYTSSDAEEASPIIQLLDSDHEGDSHIEIELNLVII